MQQLFGYWLALDFLDDNVLLPESGNSKVNTARGLLAKIPVIVLASAVKDWLSEPAPYTTTGTKPFLRCEEVEPDLSVKRTVVFTMIPPK